MKGSSVGFNRPIVIGQDKEKRSGLFDEVKAHGS
jgi:hypothetical protein